NWNVTSGYGIIRSRINDLSGNPMSGVTVSAYSQVHQSSSWYTVCYQDGCPAGGPTATDSATGRYIVKDVEPGDTVTVTAQKTGWSFNQRVFHIWGDSLHNDGIGASYSYNVSFDKSINSLATYLVTSQDPNAVQAVPFSLAELGIRPADTITLVAAGQVSFSTTANPPYPETSTGLAGLFSTTPNVSGAIAVTNAPPFVTGATGRDNIPTDITQDFYIGRSQGTTVVVPAGAAYLFVILPDIYYSDNSAGSLAVQIRFNSSCNFSLDAALAFLPMAGATSNTVNVATANGCAWTAVSNNSDWLHVTGGATGNGNGTVTYTVDSAGTARTGTITIAGQTFTVGQGGIALSDASQVFNSSTAATTGGVSVIGASDVSWSAASNDSWITITSGFTGTGNGMVNFSVSANPGSVPRTGTITIGGQTFTVTQAGTIVQPFVGTWGGMTLHRENNGNWYSESLRINFNVDGSGTVEGTNNDGSKAAGLRIKTFTESFTYTAALNADGSYTLTMNFLGDNKTETIRLVFSDNGDMALVDGTGSVNEVRLVTLVKIDTTRNYTNSDVAGDYYSIGYERNVDGAVDPPYGNGSYMAISGIQTFNGAGTYAYFGKANSVKVDGSNYIWDDPGKTNQPYTVNPDGSFTGGGGAYLGYMSGDGRVFAGAGSYVSNNWVGYFFMKKGDRTYQQTDLAGKWAIVSFGQDSQAGAPV
ncbi:MAG: BACON domain-containing carbohydrate-binding protein, partial [Pseudomonadota bacterium]